MARQGRRWEQHGHRHRGVTYRLCGKLQAVLQGWRLPPEAESRERMVKGRSGGTEDGWPRIPLPPAIMEPSVMRAGAEGPATGCQPR